MTLDDIRRLTPFEGKLVPSMLTHCFTTSPTLEGTVMAVQAPDGTELRAEYVRIMLCV